MPSMTFQINSEHAKITEVVRGLFVGGVCALSPSIIKHYQITAIINVTEEVPNVKSVGNVRYAKLWIEDNEQFNIYPLLELLSNQIQAILSSGGRVLVHSVHGVSRCAAICLAYLTKFRCKTLKDAYEKLASTRPVVAPNMGFWRQLIAFEQEVKQTHGSVQIVRDRTEPTKLVPDVYARSTKSSTPSTSRLDATFTETNSKNFQSIAAPEFENLSVVSSENIPPPTLRKTDKTEKRKRPINRAGKNSIPSAKFHPVLETLHEVVEVAA